ncbi:HD domain-containing protein [Bacillus carboniphilus]|uniref:HD domain-containing protein n=1 Tax=Bacillus carboniphilus TaxID=86663 RepID=A0ABN0WW28_9BACI
MNDLLILEEKIKELFLHEATGHDWYHIDRVRKVALFLCEQEGGNPKIVEAAALLHDVPDEKLNPSKQAGEKRFYQVLSEIPFTKTEREEIEGIVFSISFKGGNEATLTNLNAKIVRDADRLDAMGAIGVARTFAYGGSNGQPLYNPNLKVRDEMSEEEYRNQPSSSIHHFYEKLLKLKGLMTTESGRRLAEERHQFMEQFLEQFFLEWQLGQGSKQDT